MNKNRILYNVTVKVEFDVLEEWKKWMLDIHIPDVLNTGCFTSYMFNRILGDDNEYGVTFAIQYLSPDMDHFTEYQNKYMQQLQAEHKALFADKCVAFRTLMEVISDR